MSSLRPVRALVLTAQVGESHAAMAQALAAGLRSRSAVEDADVPDPFDVLGRPLGTVLDRGFRFHLGRVGWSYNLAYAIFTRRELARRSGERALYELGGRALLATVARHDPDVVVSTHPVLSAVLGRVRASGRMRCPAAAVVGPLGGLGFWAQAGIDLHLLLYPEALPEVERVAGSGRALPVRPLVRSEFLEHPKDARGARAELGLPRDGPLIVVSGGGWGAGDVEGALSACLAWADVHVIVVAGRNEPLRADLERRHGRDPRVSLLGFSAHMRDLMCAADVFVTATAGISAIEARLCGCQLVCYGFPVGHVRDNTRALAAHGFARVAGTPAELTLLLRSAMNAGRQPVPRLRELPDPAEALVRLARTASYRVTPRPRVPAL